MGLHIRVQSSQQSVLLIQKILQNKFYCLPVCCFQMFAGMLSTYCSKAAETMAFKRVSTKPEGYFSWDF